MGLLNLVGRISLDGAPFKQTLQGLKKEASSFGSVLSGQLSGLVGAGAMIGLAKGAIEAADKVDEVAERLGVSTLEAQQFALAAKLGGTEIDFFATKFEKLRDALRSGAAKGENPLAVFGIGATTDPAVAMKGLSDLIIDVGLSAEQSTAFVELMGKGSGKLINVLGDLRNAKSGTLFFSDNDIESLKQADDFMTKIGNTAKVAFSKIALFATSLRGASAVSNPLLALVGAGGTKGAKGAGVNEAGILEAQAEAEAAAKIHMAEQDDLLKIQADANRIFEQNRIARLTTEERMNELLKEQKTLRENLLGTEEDEIGTQMMRKRLAEVESGILRGEKKTEKGASPLKDSLTSVGNFLGANPNSGQMKEFSEMNRKLDAIVRNTARTGGSIFPQ